MKNKPSIFKMLSLSCLAHKRNSKNKLELSPETNASHVMFVDLGLSIKWATCNLGASKPEEHGQYFQWEDAQGYDYDTRNGKHFNWEYSNGEASHKWFTATGMALTKYATKSSCNSVDATETTLNPGDDAAYAVLGREWRMPTDNEWTELRNNCTWAWSSINSIYGYIVTSNMPGYTNKSIFLPATGYWKDGHLIDVGFGGYYWSSSLHPYYPNNAYSVYFYSNRIIRYYFSQHRYLLCVRPVSK